MKRVLGVLLSAAVLSFCAGVPAFAGEKGNEGLLERIKKLEERLGERTEGTWMDRITISGVVEVEGGFGKTDFAAPGEDDEDSSDLTLATVELGVDAEISDYVSAHVLFLYEDDEDVVVDEGTITIGGGEKFPMYLTAGKMYVPFGSFETAMISDPLTLELGETRETAVLVGSELNGFYGSAYVFNGDVDEDGDDSHIDNFGLNAGYAVEKDGFSVDVGVSYINNLLDSDGWEDIRDGGREEAEEQGYTFAPREYVGGIGVHAIVNVGPFSVIGEYVTALEEVEWNNSDVVAGTLASMGRSDREEGIKPSTWNIEVDYTFELLGKETVVGMAYQGSDDTGNEFPEARYMGVVGMEIFTATTLALEYYHDEFENDDKADQLTAQLAVEF